MKKFIFTLILVCAAAAYGVFYFSSGKSTAGDAYELRIGGETYAAVIADSEDERVKGLSDRESFPADSVLVFAFPRSYYWGIWMKDMKFPIDIIWLDDRYAIVGEKENATPESYPETFQPQSPATYVVEANTGFIERHSLKMGDRLELIKIR